MRLRRIQISLRLTSPLAPTSLRFKTGKDAMAAALKPSAKAGIMKNGLLKLRLGTPLHRDATLRTWLYETLLHLLITVEECP